VRGLTTARDSDADARDRGHRATVWVSAMTARKGTRLVADAGLETATSGARRATTTREIRRRYVMAVLSFSCCVSLFNFTMSAATEQAPRELTAASQGWTGSR
jgi:hypothetical protein